MGVIGCLGDVVFTVSRDVVKTLNNMNWSGSARHTVHNRHLTHALTEFTGLDPDKFSFDMLLSADLGVDPLTEIAELFSIERSGKAVPLTIGTHGYGIYRWTIIKLKVKTIAFYTNGDMHTATVAVSLQEYL